MSSEIRVKILSAFEVMTCDENGKEGSKRFDVGDTVELTILGHPLMCRHGRLVDDCDHVNVRFADGTIAGCVSRDWFCLDQ